MTENGKKFLEQASQDEALKAELQAELQKAQAEAIKKIAAAHGMNLTAEDLKAGELTELSEDELKAVAGGSTCGCVMGGGGGGKLTCACVMGGAGKSDTTGRNMCTCVVVGDGYL